MKQAGQPRRQPVELPVPVDVLNLLPMAVYATDAGGFVTYANHAAAELAGREPNIGVDRWSVLWRMYDMNGVLLAPEACPLAEAILAGRVVRGARIFGERPDGQRVLVQSYPAPIHDANGQLTGALNVLVELAGSGIAVEESVHLRRAEKAAWQLAAIVASSDDAIISKNLDGTITSWNAGAERLFGYTADEALGQSISIIYPDGHKAAFRDVLDRIRAGERIEHYETIRQRKDGSLVDISLTVSPVRDLDDKIIGASKIARDITDRMRSEDAILQHAREQSALYRLTDVLYHAGPIEDAFKAALEAIAVALKCERASILMFDATGTMNFVAWHGLSEEYRRAVAGHSPWQAGEANAEPITVENVEKAADLTELLPVLRAENIGSLAFVPVSASGGVVGKFMVYYDQPHSFTRHEMEVAQSIARQLGFGMERTRAEQQRDLLVAELSHRVKNTLANVLSIAQQTFRRSDSREKASFEGRILAMAQTHTRLAESSWAGVPFITMLRDELGPLHNPDTVSLSGPPVTLEARAAVLLGMAFHELATNAVRFGALSTKEGRVAITWSVKGGSLTVEWVETGGPPVTPPRRKGFGRLMLERALASDLGSSVKLEFAPAGVRCSITLPIRQQVAEGSRW